jgi:hypothetical protein
MAVNDILLLSDRMAGESLVLDEMGSSIDKVTSCDSDDRSSLKFVLEARRGAIEKLMYYSACAEQSSEHPIAKGSLIDIVSWEFALRLQSLTSNSSSFLLSNSCKGIRIWYWRGTTSPTSRGREFRGRGWDGRQMYRRQYDSAHWKSTLYDRK